MKKGKLIYRENQDKIDFIQRHWKVLAQLWEKENIQEGYIQVYVGLDYKPSKSGVEIVYRKIDHSTFVPLIPRSFDKYAYVEFLWLKTATKNRFALGYNLIHEV